MACSSGASQDRHLQMQISKRPEEKNKMDEMRGYHRQIFVHEMGGTMGNVNLLHGLSALKNDGSPPLSEGESEGGCRKSVFSPACE